MFAATDLFFELGFHGTSIRKLAAKAGVEVPTVYYYYNDKENLLFVLMHRTMSSIMSAVDHAIGENSKPDKAIEAAMRTHIRFHGSQRKEVFVADSEMRALTGEARETIIQMRREYEQCYQTLIDNCTGNELRVDDVKALSYAILGMCNQISTWYSPGRKASLDEIADKYVALTLRGLTGMRSNSDARPPSND